MFRTLSFWPLFRTCCCCWVVKPKWNFVHYALHSKYILCLHLHNCIHLHLWTCTCIHLHTCVHLHILLRSCNFFHIFIEYFAVCTEFCLCSGLVKYFLLRFSNVQIVQILLLFNLFPEFIFLVFYILFRSCNFPTFTLFYAYNWHNLSILANKPCITNFAFTQD